MRVLLVLVCFFFFFFNDTATTEIYTLSLHDALPISLDDPFTHVLDTLRTEGVGLPRETKLRKGPVLALQERRRGRSEEHTSELQSPCNLVCRLLLEKKKNTHSLST